MGETVYVAFKLEKEIKELIWKVAKLQGTDASSFIRRAVLKELAKLSFLSEEQKKALGVD